MEFELDTWDLPVEMKKRTYAGAILSCVCECGIPLSHDFSSSYFSYPVASEPEDITLCCEGHDNPDGDDWIDGCGAEYSTRLVLTLTVGFAD